MVRWCLFLLGLVIQTYSQSCSWGDFNLIGAQGYEIQCVVNGDQNAIGMHIFNIYLYIDINMV